MNRFSILINTCDAYSDAWTPFFQILEKTWPDASKYPIYLNTESKDYKNDFYDIRVLNCCKNMPWGQRLLNAVSQIDSDYILMLLEDFFFEEYVNDIEILKCADYLERYPKIACFSFTCAEESFDQQYCVANSDDRFPSFVKRKQFGDYKYNASPTLWRKSSLEKWTFRKDSPWQWEFFGNTRTWFSKDEFYALRVDAKPVFVYDVIHGGAIHRGKWVGYKMKELEERFGLELDLSHRTIEEDWMTNPHDKVKPFYKRINSVIKNRIKFIESVIIGFFYR